MSNKIYRAFSERLGNQDIESFVAKEGELFWDPETTELRVGDGSAGGQVISSGGGSGPDTVARGVANAASANTVYLQGVDNTQNASIIAINTKAQAAFDKANTSSGEVSASSIVAARTIDSSNTTLTVADSGGIITLIGTALTLTLPDPTTCSGAKWTFYQNTASQIRLDTPVNAFYGPSGSASNTKVLTQTITQYWNVWSDGENWIVFAMKLA